ncbi:MAG TPA: YbaK/EbsC family protein [Stellaceae bacterium]|nr:YbaK/EbsC family protein [Stellaceae bacterium]
MSPEVRAFLEGAGIQYRTHKHAPLVSFEAAKTVLPFDPGAMVKGLVFRTPSEAFAIVALRGADRADYKKIADALGVRRADLRAADPADVEAELGMQLGGIVPLPIKGAVVLIDQGVAALDTIFCGSGRNDVTLELKAQDLVQIAPDRVGGFAKPVAGSGDESS